MFKNQSVVAIALCFVFLAAIVGIYIHERAENAYNMEVYQRVIPEREKRQAEINQKKDALAKRRENARLNYLNAAETYLPGVAFFGDSLLDDTNGGGMDLRSTVSSLIRSSVCNPATVYINVTNNVDYSEYLGYFPIIFMGDETPLSDIDYVLALQRQYIGTHDRYIVLGATRGSKEEMQYLEAAMEQAYGERYINIREYMSTDGLPSLELEITALDRQAMNEGRIPPSLLKSDGLHLNDNGKRLLAYLTYERMSDLGYFDEIISAKEIFDEAEEATIND